jgi:hypothetical protein
LTYKFRLFHHRREHNLGTPDALVKSPSMQLGLLPRRLPACSPSVRDRFDRIRHRSRHRPRLSRSPSRKEPDGGPDAPSTPQKSPYSVVSRGDPERQNGRKSWKAGERCGSSMQSSRREKTTFAKGWSAPQGTQPIGARQPTAARRAIGLSGCTCKYEWARFTLGVDMWVFVIFVGE